MLFPISNLFDVYKMLTLVSKLLHNLAMHLHSLVSFVASKFKRIPKDSNIMCKSDGLSKIQGHYKMWLIGKTGTSLHHSCIYGTCNYSHQGMKLFLHPLILG